jgi:hypothetical protein
MHSRMLHALAGKVGQPHNRTLGHNRTPSVRLISRRSIAFTLERKRAAHRCRRRFNGRLERSLVRRSLQTTLRRRESAERRRRR